MIRSVRQERFYKKVLAKSWPRGYRSEPVGNKENEVVMNTDSEFQPATIGNILIGGVIGIGVDSMTGAAMKYPTSVEVPLVCKNAAVAPLAAADSAQ